jgi:2-phospho-L-lactate guanylyltransferase
MVYPETWALVPVKRFSRAKSRLGDILLPAERVRLAQAMLRDVLGNLSATGSLDGIAVVSADPEAFAIARSFGAAVIFDSAEVGINEAVQFGLDALHPYRRRVLVVPADIPFARPKEFENVIELLEHTPIVLVPALHDGGTNGLAMRAPDLLQPQFGEDSFKSHRDLARQRRLGCSVLKSDGIGKDIDCPLDFGPCLISPKNLGLTGSFLDELNIAERFGVNDAPAPLRLF